MSKCCPICNAETKVWTSISDYVVHEESEDCPNGCYHYEYLTGSFMVVYTIRGHRISFFWGYQDSITGWEVQNRLDACHIVEHVAKRIYNQDGGWVDVCS